MLPSPLVDVAWLAGCAPGAVHVFDATKFLPDEGRDGQHEFYGAHIPGARFFDIDLVADQDTALPHMAPTPGRFARLMGQMGVADGDAVVFYDQKGQASAARGWWLMQLFGHANVALLDGGLPAWRAAGLPVQAGLAERAGPAVFTPTLNRDRIRHIGDMLATVALGDALVLDARPAARFAGTAPEPRPGVQPGHIPGSRSLPAADLLAPDGRFLPPEALRARFRAAGVDGSLPVVTTCGTGVTAATLAFALHLAGLPEAAVYDGSWAEWGSRADTPKELGR